jgi:hypothetical protein
MKILYYKNKREKIVMSNPTVANDMWKDIRDEYFKISNGSNQGLNSKYGDGKLGLINKVNEYLGNSPTEDINHRNITSMQAFLNYNIYKVVQNYYGIMETANMKIKVMKILELVGC